MDRTLNQVIAKLPPKRKARVLAQYRKLRKNIGGLQELRMIAGKAQSEVAVAMKIKQPSVSKIEQQTDLNLSTLRNYVRAVGGKLELVVKLPSNRTVSLSGLTKAT